ncbi:hypothetical protein C8R43DRAFT_962628 [Mycena crocata]|nr:hypothetical protein C8R43DRAFT_962628 [Mycena crocata]
MSSSEPPPNSDTKAARRQAALKRYALKHAKKLRVSARGRMQRFRSQPATEERQEKELASAKKYRNQNRESIRIADSVRRAEKSLRTQREENDEKARAQLERERRVRARRTLRRLAPPSPPPLPQSARHRRGLLDLVPPNSESDSELATEQSCVIPERIFYRGISPRPRSPTPDLECNCRWPQYCGKCTCGCDYMCCLYHHKDESEYRQWMKQLTYFGGGSKEDRHWRIIGPADMVRYQQSSTPGAPIRCIPEYFPSPGINSTAEHSHKADCLFYAVVTPGASGIYTDYATQIHTVEYVFPGTVVLTDPDWIGINNKWEDWCDEHHNHWAEWRSQFVSASRTPSPISSAASTFPSPPQSPTPSPRPISMKPVGLFDPPFSSTTGPRQAKAPLRSPRSRPAASVSSLGSLSSLPSSSSIASHFDPPTSSSQPCILPYQLPNMNLFPESPRKRSSIIASAISAPSKRALPVEPVQHEEVYTVSVVNTVFKDSAHAWKVFQETDGAEILGARTLDEVTTFFEERWAKQDSPTIYVVSGHRVAFKNREKAYQLFLQKQGAEMFLTRSSVEAQAYIAKNCPL